MIQYYLMIVVIFHICAKQTFLTLNTFHNTCRLGIYLNKYDNLGFAKVKVTDFQSRGRKKNENKQFRIGKEENNKN